jgi:hypothetical protein
VVLTVELYKTEIISMVIKIPPQYNWNIVESGFKHQNQTNLTSKYPQIKQNMLL